MHARRRALGALFLASSCLPASLASAQPSAREEALLAPASGGALRGGAAVAIDTAVCLGCTTAGVVIAVVAPTCAPGACAGLAAYLALPLQFYLSGAKPEQKPVHVELGPAQPKADPAPATAVPSTPEPPQPQYGY